MNKEAKILLGLTIGTILVLVGGVFFFSTKEATPQATETKTYDEKLLLGENSAVKGATEPKVTIVEFGDFQCPACAASYPNTNALVEEYKDKVKFVFRHFPLQQHAQAMDASRAAEGAAAQGKFWEMHDKLYGNLDQWAEKSDAVTIFEGYAKELGLNVDEFKKAFTDKPYDAKIRAGMTDGNAVGVTATPTFYVNGQKVVGVFSVEEWKRLLDEYLK